MGREEIKKLLKEFRKESDRQVLIVEDDLAVDNKRTVFSISNRFRLAGNELTAFVFGQYILNIRDEYIFLGVDYLKII